MSTIVLEAPAKVNLFLAVGTRRADGYHELSTVFQALSLCDEVLLDPDAPLRVEYDPGIGVPVGRDLVARAAIALARRLDRPPVGAFRVHKRIPLAAGLGGGSSDAAAALVGLATAWGLSIADPMLAETAALLGADVPFFLLGGTALYSGRGDVFERRLPTPDLDVVLVNPRERASTPAVYAAFDRSSAPLAPAVQPLIAALEHGDAGLAGSLFNSLEGVTMGLVPAVEAVEKLLRADPGVIGSLMSGSGPTVFGLCDGSATARRIVERARAKGWWARATRTGPGGARVAGGAGSE